MATAKLKTLSIDSLLQDRLSVLAEKQGVSLDQLAESVLRSHADRAEARSNEVEEDEQRWQKYLETNESVPVQQVRAKLQSLAAKAGQA